MRGLPDDCPNRQQEQGCRRAAHVDCGGTVEGDYSHYHGDTGLAGDHRRAKCSPESSAHRRSRVPAKRGGNPVDARHAAQALGHDSRAVLIP